MDGGQKMSYECKTSELEETCTTKEKHKSNEKTEKSSKKQVNKCKLSLFRNSIKSVKTLATNVDLNETDEFQDKQPPLQLPERLTRKKSKISDSGEYHSLITQKSVGESVHDDEKISQQTCPTCQRSYTPLQMQAHIFSCLKQFALVKNNSDNEKNSDKDMTDYHLCQICQKDISHMNTTRRAQHVNRCIDEKEKVCREKEEKKRLLETAKTAVLDCPICGKPLKTSQSRQTHIKKCALTYGVSTERLLKLIKDQEGERTLQVAAGILPNTVRLPTKVSKDGEKSSKQQRLPKTKSDEDLQLAMALSTSIAEQQRLQEEVVAGGSRLPQGKKSRFKKKAVEAIPLILQLTKQQSIDRISGKVTELLLPPPTSQDQELSSPCGASQIETLSVPCEVYSTSRNQQTTRLWNESKLTNEDGNIKRYYVEALMPSVNISTVKAGTKFKRLSEIPGRRSSFELEKERELKQKSDGDLLQQTDNKSQTTSSPPVTQTAAILAELAAEADINSSHPEKFKNSNQSQEELHFSGFCLENPLEIPEDLLRPIKDSLSPFILSMVSNEMYSDVTIETRERKIPAHKIFLHSRCPKMLESLSVDGVTIDMSVYSEDVVLTILKFIYAGEVMVYPASLQDVLQLSLCLGLTELKELCESVIKRKPEAQDKESKEDRESNVLDNTLWSSSDSEEDMAEGHGEGEEVQGQEDEEEDEWREMFYTQRENLRKISIEECLENNENSGDDGDGEEIDDDDNRNNDSEEEVMHFLLKEKYVEEKCSGKADNNTNNECRKLTTSYVDCPSVNQNVETIVLDKIHSVSDVFQQEQVKFSKFQSDRLSQIPTDVTKKENSKDMSNGGSENLDLKSASPANKFSEFLSVSYSQKRNIDGNIQKSSCNTNSVFVESDSTEKDVKICRSQSMLVSSPVNPNMDMTQDALDSDTYHNVQSSDQELFSDDDGILANPSVEKCFNTESDYSKENSEKIPSGSPIRDHGKKDYSKKKTGDFAESPAKINYKVADYQENSIVHPILLSDSDSNEEDIKLDAPNLRDKNLEYEFKPLSVKSHTDKRTLRKHERELNEFSQVDMKESGISVTDVHAIAENKRNHKYKFVSIGKRSNTKNRTKLLGSLVSSNVAGDDTKLSSAFMQATPNSEISGDKKETHLTYDETTENIMVREASPSSQSLETKSLGQLSGSNSDIGRHDKNNLDSIGEKSRKTTDSIKMDDDDDDEVVIFSASSNDGELSSSPKFGKKFQMTSDMESDNGNDEEDPWEGFNDVGYTEDIVVFDEDPVLPVPDEMSDEMIEEDLSSQQQEPQMNFKTPTVSGSVKKKKKAWVPPSPFTPIPDYNTMNTPQLKKNLDKYGLRPACKKRMISVLTQIYAETHQYETDSDCELDKDRLEKANQTKIKNITSKNVGKGDKKSKLSQPIMQQKKSTAKPPVSLLREVVSDDPLSSSQSSDISDLPEESFIAMAEGESSSSTSQCTKEDLFKKLAGFIQYDIDLYSQILMYKPVELDVLKKRIGEAGMKCSMEKLLEFLDEKCINFTMKNTNKRKPRNQRRRPKTKKIKPSMHV